MVGRAFQDLSAEEQEIVSRTVLNRLLSAVVEGQLVFDDQSNGEDLQRRIDQAVDRAHEQGCSVMAASFVMEIAGEELQGIADYRARTATYPEASLKRASYVH